jgi:hypothetical protein
MYVLRGKILINGDWVAIWKEELSAYLKAPYYIDTEEISNITALLIKIIASFPILEIILKYCIVYE